MMRACAFAGLVAIQAIGLSPVASEYGDSVQWNGHKYIMGATMPQVHGGTPFILPEEENVWSAFQFVEGTKCMDGRETGVYLRKGRDQSKLVLHFQGGGACFNAFSCSAVAEDPEGGGTPGYEGIFSFDDERNQLRDYSVMFVPYCTGDVHVGHATTVVAGVSRSFFGRFNLNLVMQRLIPTFPDVTQVVLAGVSAGGVGGMANFDFIALGFHVAKRAVHMTLLNDCGPVMDDIFLTPCLQQEWRDTWGVNEGIPPDCEGCADQPDGGGLLNFMPFLQSKWHDSNFALVETTRDAVIALFYSFGRDNCQVGGLPGDYSDKFEEGLQDVFFHHLGDRFAAFILTGTEHVFIANDLYYETEAQGIFLHDFVNALIAGEFIKTSPWTSKDVSNVTNV